MRHPPKQSDPKPSRGMPRSLIYAMIPLGFILLVLIMVSFGNWREETAPEPGSVEEPLEPADQNMPQPEPAD